MENILFYILITLIDSLYYYQIDVAMHVTSHISLTLISHTRVHITTHYTAIRTIITTTPLSSFIYSNNHDNIHIS